MEIFKKFSGKLRKISLWKKHTGTKKLIEENNTCVCCGDIIPEGSLVCINCMRGAD